VTLASCGALLAGIALVTWYAATHSMLDFSIYLWGGHAIAGDARLYLTQGYAHWFTYPPFAAVLFAPIAALPGAVAGVLWQLGSVAALAVACVTTLKLAGYRPSRTAMVAVVAGALALEPVYHTLYLGQVNLFLLALVLTDVRRASRGRSAGIGVGLAAAIKLTPAIFVVLFLVTRRTRAAVTASATFACCALAGYLIAPDASRLYWSRLFYDTSRVGAPYISNQSPYAALVRILGGTGHVGAWFLLVPLTIGIIGLATATLLVRHDDWLGAAAATGVTGLLVSPISWTHHWVWIVPGLVAVWRAGTRGRIAAAVGYVLFAAAPLWWTPHDGGPREYGFHGLVTVVANCYLVAGLAFLAFLACVAMRARAAGRVSMPLPRQPAAACPEMAATTSLMAARKPGSVMVPSGPTHSRETGSRRQADSMTSAPT
jgi:alpha-1,2-mannosyltransferase